MGLIWGREYQLMDLPDFCFAGVGIFVYIWGVSLLEDHIIKLLTIDTNVSLH